VSSGLGSGCLEVQGGGLDERFFGLGMEFRVGFCYIVVFRVCLHLEKE
jgi:hypothetical protein